MKFESKYKLDIHLKGHKNFKLQCDFDGCLKEFLDDHQKRAHGGEIEAVNQESLSE